MSLCVCPKNLTKGKEIYYKCISLRYLYLSIYNENNLASNLCQTALKKSIFFDRMDPCKVIPVKALFVIYYKREEANVTYR